MASPHPSHQKRRYLPALKDFPTRYIHEPWKAPANVQLAANCVIGKHYPLPMVNHSKTSRINSERMKQVYRRLYNYRDDGKAVQFIALSTILLKSSFSSLLLFLQYIITFELFFYITTIANTLTIFFSLVYY